MKNAMLVATAGLILTGAANADPVTTWSFLDASLQYVDVVGDTPVWRSYNPGPTMGSTPLDNGIKLIGTGDNYNVFHLTGATYVPSPVEDPDYRGAQLVIEGTGTIDGSQWSHPNDIVRTSFGIGFGYSGGSADFYKVETGFALFDNEHNFITGVGSGTSLGVYEQGYYGVGFAFEDRFGADIHTATTIEWRVVIAFDWTGMSPEDNFDFTIEPNSIDIQAQTVPAPFTMSVFGLGGLMMRRRRS